MPGCREVRGCPGNREPSGGNSRNAADAIITIDAKGAIQSINAATERMFGYSASEMVGKNVNMIMPAPYRDDHDQYLARYQQTGESHIIGNGREVEGRRKDGSIFPVDLVVSEVDHLQLFTGILRDISRRKELEREVVEIASLEQRRIGQDLHDSVSQELTALNMMAADLTDILRSDPSKGAELADRWSWDCSVANKTCGLSCGVCALFRLTPKGSWPRYPT